VKRVFLFSVSITLLHLFVASGAGRAGESRATWQVEWEKTLKAAEAEGEVTVYVVDYPRFTVSQFQKAYPKLKLNLVDGPSGPIVDRTKEHLGVSDSYVIQVRRFLLKALRDLEAGKQAPGLVYDSDQADFSRIRCDVAYLSSNVSWRTLFEDKSKPGKA